MLWVALFLGASFAVFGRALSHDFVLLDDDIHLYKNPRLLDAPATFWRAPLQGLYIPVTYSVWGAIARVGGGEVRPRFFHAVSVVGHGIAAALVFFLLWEVAGSVGAALVGALFFCWHPLQAEAVSWASGLKDILAGGLGVAALLLFFKSAESFSIRKYGSALLLLFLALAAKPSACVIPLLALILERAVLRSPWRGALARAVPAFLLALPFAVVTRLAQPESGLAFIPSWGQRALVAGDALTFYLAKLWFPFFLAPDYGRMPASILKAPSTWVVWLVPVVLYLLLRKRVPRLGLFALLFVAALLPTLGFLPFSFQVYSTVADRFAYLALLAPSLAIAFWLRGRPRGRLGPAFLVGLLGLLCSWQVSHWKDSYTLFAHTLAVNPASLVSHNNLGNLLEGQGRFDEALAHYRSALALEPRSAPAHYNAARLLARKRRYLEAESLYEKVVELDAGVADAYFSLGLIAAQRADWERAEQRYLSAIKLRPGMSAAHYRLGLVHEAKRELNHAERCFKNALRIDPSDEAAQVALARIAQAG